MIVIYTTLGSEKEAKVIARKLLEQKLIACASYAPVTSIYSWKGKLVEEKEWRLLLKTSKGFAMVKEELKKLHSYDLPCILKLDVKANKEYETWVNFQIK
jgi:periplasmic divalent cation tolerance protein